MKTKNLILMVLGAALWLAPALSIAQQRRVDWIHGLGGHANTWQNVNDTYVNQGRQIVQNSRWPYNTGVGIQNFADEITERNLGGNNTISISHSMGGTAVRQVDLDNANYWAGNITAGSPLRGGQIAVSAQNGAVQQFINQGIDQLLRGPAAGTSVLVIISPQIGFLIQATGFFGSLFSNSIVGQIVNAITGNFGLTPQTAADLNPNGNYMQNIANQGSSSPKIQVWGNEDQPIIWRVAGSYASGSDQAGVNLMNNAVGLYNAAANFEYAMRWTIPLLWGYYDWRGDRWKAGSTGCKTRLTKAGQRLLARASCSRNGRTYRCTPPTATTTSSCSGFGCSWTSSPSISPTAWYPPARPATTAGPGADISWRHHTPITRNCCSLMKLVIPMMASSMALKLVAKIFL